MSSAKIEMVAAPTPPHDSAASNGPINNDTDEDSSRNEQIIPNHAQSQLSPSPSTIHEGSPRNPPNSTYKLAYTNWSCDDDDKNHNDNNEARDDLAWKIIFAILKGWFVVWILFAILVITAEVFSPRHSNNKKVAMVTVEDEQLFLEISEHIVSSCSYSKLDTEDGREECQTLCRNNMCCFIDDDDENAAFESHRYGCASDPEKICAAYAGCESLVVSEDDAIIFDVDGVAVFGGGDSGDDTPPSGASGDATISVSNSTPPLSELQLIQQVITSVCSNDNLHTRHGMLECASLCTPSMCCFDRNEIELLNPKVDLILKMEGISDEILDRTDMGTCINEEEGNANATTPSHFCQVHAGCKNLLLFGAPSATLSLSWPSSSADPFIFTSVGMYDKNNQIVTNDDVTSEQGRMLETVCIFFGLIIGVSTYLLVCKRAAPSVAIEMAWRNGRFGDNSMDDFAPVGPVGEMVYFV